MVNQTIFKLHTVMPRGFDFDTNFPYLPGKKATCSYFPSAGFNVSQRHHIALPMPHQRHRVPIRPRLPHLQSIHPLPVPFLLHGSLRLPTKSSTPSGPGQGRCRLSSRSRGPNARATPTCRRRARLRCSSRRGGPCARTARRGRVLAGKGARWPVGLVIGELG
jgi:hypothetical protein